MGKIKKRYITSEVLSRYVGVYPEVINENLSYFEPLMTMDSSVNILELVPAIKQYIIDEEEKKTPVIRVAPVNKKEVDLYESLNDFVYKKYSVGGMIDKGAELSDKDLRIMKKLVAEELAKRKKK